MSKNNTVNFHQVWVDLENNMENFLKSSFGNETQNQQLAATLTLLQTSWPDLTKKKMEFDELVTTEDQSRNKLKESIKINDNELFKEKNKDLAFLANDMKKVFSELEQIKNEFQGNLENLNKQLKALPYSDSKIINSLCENINKLLNILADFFMNGPIISEGVYIANDSKPHQFQFFHPSQSVKNCIKDLSEALKPL